LTVHRGGVNVRLPILAREVPMAVETIEGILVAAQPRRRKWGYGYYKELSFTLPGGSERKIAKVGAGSAMVDEIARGGAGRWFVSDADGGKGLCGVHRADGTRTYAHWSNLGPILLVVGMLGVAVAIARFVFGYTELPVTPAILGPLLIAAWAWLRHQRLTAKKAFDAG